MIISNSQILSLLQKYQKQDRVYEANRGAGKNLKSTIGADEAKISENAKAYQMARDLIRELPEIREDRLVNVQRLVKKGSYEISDDEIAEKMIGRTIVDKLV